MIFWHLWGGREVKLHVTFFFLSFLLSFSLCFIVPSFGDRRWGDYPWNGMNGRKNERNELMGGGKFCLSFDWMMGVF